MHFSNDLFLSAILFSFSNDPPKMFHFNQESRQKNCFVFASSNSNTAAEGRQPTVFGCLAE